MDVSILLPYDKLKAEFFHHERTENITTKSLDSKVDVEMAIFLFTELRDPKKATSDYLSSGEVKFSWGYTTK